MDNVDSMVHKYKALFFDFDGVIVDSVSIKTEAFSKLFEKHGETIVNQIVSHHLAHGGINRIDKIKYYYNELLKVEIDEKELSLMCTNFSNLVLDKVIHAKEIDGADNFLNKSYLKTKCFVVSATLEEELIEIINKRKIMNYFKEIRGAPLKKTNHIQDLLQKYQLNPNEACFIGDAVEDYKAAKECGVDFFGIVQSGDSALLRLYPKIRWASNYNSSSFISSVFQF